MLLERYYRASAPVAGSCPLARSFADGVSLGLECICELNFADSKLPLWICTICNVAGRSVDSADAHLYSSGHRRKYLVRMSRLLQAFRIFIGVSYVARGVDHLVSEALYGNWWSASYTLCERLHSMSLNAPLKIGALRTVLMERSTMIGTFKFAA